VRLLSVRKLEKFIGCEEREPRYKVVFDQFYNFFRKSLDSSGNYLNKLFEFPAEPHA
jgi:hypothetical protein